VFDVGKKNMAIAYFLGGEAQNPKPSNNKPLRIICLNRKQVKTK